MRWDSVYRLIYGLCTTLLISCEAHPCEEGRIIRLDVALNTCNHRPEIEVMVTPPEPTKRSVVRLDASRSLDIDDDVLSFKWSLISAPVPTSFAGSPNQAEVSFVPEAVGEYLFSIELDDGALSVEEEVSVRVVNLPPIANAGTDTGWPVGQEIELDGSASFDPDGDPLQSYIWRWVQLPPTSGALLLNSGTERPSFVVDVEGLYVLELIVTDGEANSSPDEVRIGGGVEGGPPSANAGPDRIGVLGQTVQLSAAGSSDPDNDVLGYSWRFTSRPSLSSTQFLNVDQATTGFRPDQLGRYLVELVVNDGFFSSAPSIVTIDVGPGTGLPGQPCEVAGCQEGAACFEDTCVGVGRLRFSLSWTVDTDFDIHVRTPFNNEIFFGNPFDDQTRGELDVDDCIGGLCRDMATHVENIVFSREPPFGLYQVWVENFNGGPGGEFSIEVSGEVNRVFSGSLPSIAGASSPRFEVRVGL